PGADRRLGFEHEFRKIIDQRQKPRLRRIDGGAQFIPLAHLSSTLRYPVTDLLVRRYVSKFAVPDSTWTENEATRDRDTRHNHAILWPSSSFSVELMIARRSSRYYRQSIRRPRGIAHGGGNGS